MKGSARFIFDTNVLVSALLSPHSTPRQAFDRASEIGAMLASEEILQELVRTLHKPKLAPYITPTEREAFLHALLEELEMVTPQEKVSVCRDPRDNMFLEVALAGEADWLVTGDRDLLTLGSFRGATILTPAALLDQLG